MPRPKHKNLSSSLRIFSKSARICMHATAILSANVPLVTSGAYGLVWLPKSMILKNSALNAFSESSSRSVALMHLPASGISVVAAALMAFSKAPSAPPGPPPLQRRSVSLVGQALSGYAHLLHLPLVPPSPPCAQRHRPHVLQRQTPTSQTEATRGLCGDANVRWSSTCGWCHCARGSGWGNGLGVQEKCVPA